MYSTVITFNDELQGDVLNSLQTVCEKAFDNKAGKAACRVEAQNRFVFEGEEELCCCLSIGLHNLYHLEGFTEAVSKWEWIDEEPDESCDVLRELSLIVN